MSDKIPFDFMEKYYQRIRDDKDYRKKFLENPKKCIEEEYNCKIDENTRIEVLEQKRDTVIILTPEKPDLSEKDSPEAFEKALNTATEMTYDLLFSHHGAGGFLIPRESQKWILRKMRLCWLEKHNAL